MLKFLYETCLGRSILKILCKPSVSETVGGFLDSKASVFLIPHFIKKNKIDLADYESADFACFNDCFSRKIKAEKRPVNKDEGSLISPCDGLLSVYRINDLTVLPVKQSQYTVTDLLKDEDLAGEFKDGYCFVFRLCVDHYHRYCYIDNGMKGKNTFIPGVLHTVRPIALRNTPVFAQNCREYTILETEHFGKCIQMEVGALFVGKISNHHQEYTFTKGEEKGCFLYGGSTIIVLTRKDSVNLDDFVMSELNSGCEIPVRMGQRIGEVK